MVGSANAIVGVVITNPTNDTIFNRTVPLNLTLNETIQGAFYSLDGAANITFTPNATSVTMGRGNHSIIITLEDGGVNTSNTTLFTTSYIQVQVLDLETENNISSGTNTRILSSGGTTLASNTTNASGESTFEGLGPLTRELQVQAGGPAAGNYPHIFTYNFTYSTAILDLLVLLPESGSCSFITYQYVDSFYQTPLSEVDVRFWRGSNVLTQTETDTNGFLTVCLVPGLSYILESTRNGYRSQNFTDTATLTSQFVQMVRSERALVAEAEVNLHVYPEEEVLFKNDTIFFGMWIQDTGFGLSNYGIVYGVSPKVIKDTSISANNPNFKQQVASGSNSGGEYLTCIDSGLCLNLETWGANDIYVGYFYDKANRNRVWIIKRIIVASDPTLESFWINYTANNPPIDAVHAVFTEFGYGSDLNGDPSLGMIVFSFFFMAMAAMGAARNGWGIMGAMTAFAGGNVICILFELIQWWSILISMMMIFFLGKRFGSSYT
jgi:hypothetical protein